jgi:hypothetical protein
VIEPLKFSVLLRSELNAVLRFGPGCRDRKTLFASGVQYSGRSSGR